MKGYVTQVELVREAGRATLLTRKTVDTPAGVQIIEDRTPMSEASIREWLNARGWYYAGHKAGAFVYKPGHKHVALAVEVE